MAALVFLIAFGASLIGGICGIGGGVIIKPLLDMMGVADVAMVSFLSSCTVLSMALYNVTTSSIEHSQAVDGRACRSPSARPSAVSRGTPASRA